MKALYEDRRAQLPPLTDAFRWVDGEIPHVTVDVFADVAILSLYGEADAQRIAGQLLETQLVRSVYLKRRPKEARQKGGDAGLAPPEPIAGAVVEQVITRESGLAYEIVPGNGLSVGLYLDARDARSWVEQHASGATVLNLFSYTCGFGLSALKGHAKRAVNVDLSRRVLDWGERNLVHNGFSPDRKDFIDGDAFDWLERFAKKKEQFDLIILDPPGFATGKGFRFNAERDYPKLVTAAAKVLAPRGTLLACCNVENLDGHAFERKIEAGLGARKMKKVASFGPSQIDFRPPYALKVRAYRG